MIEHFKSMPSAKQRSHIQKPAPPATKTVQESKKDLSDPLMYAIALYVDNTLSLFKVDEINAKVDAFRDTLMTNLTNHVDGYKKMKFKSQKFSLEDVKSSLLSNREDVRPLLYYASRLLMKNIVYKSNNSQNLLIPYDDATVSYVLFDMTDRADPKFEDLTTGFDEVKRGEFDAKVRNIEVEKLKKMLVKDLKQLATELGIDTSKQVIDPNTGKSKKTQLLKEEMIEKISDVINKNI